MKVWIFQNSEADSNRTVVIWIERNLKRVCNGQVGRTHKEKKPTLVYDLWAFVFGPMIFVKSIQLWNERWAHEYDSKDKYVVG